MIKKEMSHGRKYSIGSFTISFLIIFILSFLVFFLIEKQVRDARFQEIKANEERVVKLEKDFLGNEFGMIMADLHYLSGAFEKYLFSTDCFENVAANWVEFSTNRRIYDQIRFVDVNGDETIRINLNAKGGYVVPIEELQNKKDRYYFYETVKYEEGSIYVSPLDLNIENGKIEIPYKPMIRFSTPLYDENGALQGIIVLNYLADNVLKSFKALALNSNGEIALLNSNGFWLSSSDQSIEWNFMFDDRKDNNFVKKYSSEWNSILKGNNQIITSNGLFTFTPVDLLNKINASSNNADVHLGDGSWYIVSSVLRDGTNKSMFVDNIFTLLIDIIKSNSVYFLLVVIISGIIAFLAHINRKSFSRIKYYSEFDVLTKTLNRRAGMDKLSKMFPIDDRRHFVVSLCFIDVNGLKQVNDILGHKFGDELLIAVTDVVKAYIRADDFIIRLGGDEFLIVFDGIGVDAADDVWNRIKEKYECINNNEDRPYIISVSHGIVGYENNNKSQLDYLIKTADEKMYEEKRIIKETLTVIKRQHE